MATPSSTRALTPRTRAAMDWYWQHRFALLVALLLVAIGVEPLLTELVTRLDLPGAKAGLFALSALLGITMIALVAGLVRGRARAVVVLIGIAYVVTLAIGASTSSVTLTAANEGSRILVCALGIVACARRALRLGRVDAERISAALGAYLLAGFAMGIAYWTLETIWPDSFLAPETSDLSRFKAVYFSFITLATVGYGDISPASDVTRGLAVLEAVAGQGYMALLVARLVSLYGASDGPDGR